VSKYWISLLIAVLVLSTNVAAASEPHPQAAAKDSPIIMYATKTCGYCAQARAYFTARGVPWEERDIEASDQARDEWRTLGGFATPLIVINGRNLTGFSQRELDLELAKRQ